MKNWEKEFDNTPFEPDNKIYGGEVMDREMIKQFIKKVLETKKSRRAYCEICRVLIDSDTGERTPYA